VPLALRLDLHLPHLRLLVQVPQADQPPDLLRRAGKRHLQHRHADLRGRDRGRARLGVMPIPRLHHPDVRQLDAAAVRMAC
jgi:hypothetical protein